MLTKTHPNSPRFIAAVLTCAAPLFCFGASEEPPEFQLDPYYVVVTTRTPLSLDRVSPSVEYVSADEMSFWQDQSLVDALERTPGLILWSNGSKGNLTSLSSRGTESNHTGFFLEGRRVNPGFGNQYDLEFLSLSNARSAEVQRGASSVNYGSSGIGGVVDVRLESGLGKEDATGEIFAEVGSNDYRKGGFSVAVGSDTYGLSISGATSRLENERENNAYENQNLTSRYDLELADHLFFEFIGQVSDTKKELPGTTIGPTPFDEQDTTNWMLSPGLRFMTDALSMHLFYSRSERKADIFEVNSVIDYSVFPAINLGDFPISNEIDVESDEVNLQVDYSINDDALLTFGAVYRNDAVLNTNIKTYQPLDPPTPYSESFQQWGGYAQLIWRIYESLELRGGIRYDDYSDYDDETTGNAELIYYLDNLDAAMFAKVAGSYAPPSAVDLAYDSDQTTPLNAEESLSYELGFRQTLLGDDLTYSLVFFRSEIDDLLSFNPVNFDTINIEKAVTEGVEVFAEYVMNEKWTVGLGYTYLRAVSDRLNDPRTGGFVADPADNVPLARRPSHLLQVSTAYQLTDSIRIGLLGLGQFDREDIDPSTFLQVEAEDFFVVRGVVDWEINDRWSAYARVENLLDESYASAAGYPALGRAGYIGARFNF